MHDFSIDFESIDRLFHPRSIAVAGASARKGNQGRMLLESVAHCGYKGKIYVVNPRGKVGDWDTYDKVSDIPGPVDHLIVCVPARFVSSVIADAGKKGVRSAAVFTSGFSEWGAEEGDKLQEELKNVGKESGVRLIGPNCMGFFCPSTGLSFRPDFSMLDGPVGYISQSGGMAITGIHMGEDRGVGFSKVISYGNETDLGPPELLDYLTQDPATKVILLYIEGTDRGDQLLAALKRATSKKPVFFLKGGSTATGLRAVASHTGAMAGSGGIWEAMARQAGAVVVYDIDELMDAAQISCMMTKPAGRRVGLLTISGGFGVFATDVVVNAGFRMPEYSGATKEKLEEIIKNPGTSVHNPLDMAASFFWTKSYPTLVEALNSDSGIDVCVILLAVDYLTLRIGMGGVWAHNIMDKFLEALKELKKPAAFVFFRTGMNDVRLELEKKIIDAGYPLFPTVERCMKAMDRQLKANR